MSDWTIEKVRALLDGPIEKPTWGEVVSALRWALDELDESLTTSAANFAHWRNAEKTIKDLRAALLVSETRRKNAEGSLKTIHGRAREAYQMNSEDETGKEWDIGNKLGSIMVLSSEEPK